METLYHIFDQANSHGRYPIDQTFGGLEGSLLYSSLTDWMNAPSTSPPSSLIAGTSDFCSGWTATGANPITLGAESTSGQSHSGNNVTIPSVQDLVDEAYVAQVLSQGAGQDSSNETQTNGMKDHVFTHWTLTSATADGTQLSPGISLGPSPQTSQTFMDDIIHPDLDLSDDLRSDESLKTWLSDISLTLTGDILDLASSASYKRGSPGSYISPVVRASDNSGTKEDAVDQEKDGQDPVDLIAKSNKGLSFLERLQSSSRNEEIFSQCGRAGADSNPTRRPGVLLSPLKTLHKASNARRSEMGENYTDQSPKQAKLTRFRPHRAGPLRDLWSYGSGLSPQEDFGDNLVAVAKPFNKREKIDAAPIRLNLSSPALTSGAIRSSPLTPLTEDERSDKARGSPIDLDSPHKPRKRARRYADDDDEAYGDSSSPPPRRPGKRRLRKSHRRDQAEGQKLKIRIPVHVRLRPRGRKHTEPESSSSSPINDRGDQTPPTSMTEEISIKSNFTGRSFDGLEISTDFPLFYRRFPASSYIMDEATGSSCSLFNMPHPGGIFNPPRGLLDLYTPRFVRGRGTEKVGLCPICVESPERGGEGRRIWLAMKFSAFKCYHMQYAHGISASTGRPFFPPVAFRKTTRVNPGKKEKPVIQEGKCHKCSKWVPVEGIKDMESKVPEIFWWKHAASCHHNSSFADEEDMIEKDHVYEWITNSSQKDD